MSKERFFVLDADDGTLSVKAGTAATEGRFSLLETRGGTEFVYVISGELAVDLDGVTHRLTSGMCALAPSGAAGPAHALRLPVPDAPEHYVLAAGQARPTRIPLPPAFSVKARTADTGGVFSLLEVTLAQPVPRHTHHVADECVYVLDGELEVEFDGTVRRLGAGQFVLLPHGVPHALRPVARPPRVLQISSPGGWEFVVEALIEHRTEVSRAGRFDPAALNRYTREHHVVYEVN